MKLPKSSMRNAARLLVRLTQDVSDTVSPGGIILFEARLDQVVGGKKIIAGLENRARGAFGRHDAFGCAPAQLFGSAEMIHHWYPPLHSRFQRLKASDIGTHECG